ncbi:MAG: hypothetical protein OXT71_13505 [Acidobacteriota bacterium]|nr:hypothetical protein [Acidobacteriota bacterium]
MDLAAALGDRYEQTMIFHVVSGHSTLLMDSTVKAEHKLSVSLDNLVGMTVDLTPSAELTIEEITPEIRQLPGGRPMPVCKLRTAAGSEALDPDEEVKAYAYFLYEWLSRQRLVSERFSIISVMGESIEPTLPQGCVILLDHNRKRRL